MLHDDKAVMGLPIYLLVAIIAATIVIAVLSIALYSIWSDSQFHQVEHEINKITSDAENMFEYADEGTSITIHVEFPSYMRFIVFGSLPRYDGISEPANITLDENTSNNYYFVMGDGQIKTAHSNARFSGKNTEEMAIFHAGTYDLKLELIKEVDGKTYVKIY
jgi:hypothetical protein